MQTHLQRAAVVLVCFYPSRSSMRRPSRCTALSIVRSTVLINPNTFLNRGSSHPSVSRRFNNPLLAAAECTRAASGIYRAWSMMEQYPNRAHSRRHQKEKKIQKKKKATLKKEKKGKKNKPKQPALSPQLQCWLPVISWLLLWPSPKKGEEESPGAKFGGRTADVEWERAGVTQIRCVCACSDGPFHYDSTDCMTQTYLTVTGRYW